MAKRASIVIPFNYDDSWSGGNYYILNLVASLNHLPPDLQPDVCVLSSQLSSYEFIQNGAKYPRARWASSLDLGATGSAIPRLVATARKMLQLRKTELRYDVVFPFPIDYSDRARNLCWIPDFQEKSLPEFFSEEEIVAREKQHRLYIESFDHIVFSSETAEKDFRLYFPDAATKTHVIKFAVAESIAPADSESVLRKYDLTTPFFYCPNQFWAHKNHRVLIEAAHILKARGITFTVAFSGKEHDRRAPEYFNSLKQIVEHLSLTQEVRLLGFLPKADQAALLDQAEAIVQPSLFEGWSTVIEDAKAVSQYIVASDIPVHREQLTYNFCLFNPTSASALAENLLAVLRQRPVRTQVNYDQNRRKFANDFLTVVNSVMDRQGRVL